MKQTWKWRLFSRKTINYISGFNLSIADLFPFLLMVSQLINELSGVHHKDFDQKFLKSIVILLPFPYVNQNSVNPNFKEWGRYRNNNTHASVSFVHELLFGTLAQPI